MIEYKTIREMQASGKTWIVAEIGQAHDGSLGILHSMIEEAANAGVDAVKFQIHIAEAESSALEPFRVNFSYEDRSRFEYWKRMELSEDAWVGVKDKCDLLGVEFLATPFSNAAVELLERLGVNRYKIGSGDLMNPLLIKRVAMTGKEVILSTGLCDLSEIDNTVTILKKHDCPFVILQCTTQYPTEAKNIGLSWVSELAERYQCPTGLSDHSGTIFPGIAAAALKAGVVEVHVTFDKRMFGPDSKASLTFDQLKELVEGIMFINQATIHNVEKTLSAEKLELARIFGKSLAVNKDMSAGDEISFNDLEGKKPADAGISVDKIEVVLGRVLKVDKKCWEFIKEKDID